jgi:hypothetical protein
MIKAVPPFEAFLFQFRIFAEAGFQNRVARIESRLRAGRMGEERVKQYPSPRGGYKIYASILLISGCLPAELSA